MLITLRLPILPSYQGVLSNIDHLRYLVEKMNEDYNGAPRTQVELEIHRDILDRLAMSLKGSDEGDDFAEVLGNMFAKGSRLISVNRLQDQFKFEFEDE